MLNETELSRLTDLLTKTEKTPDETVELAALRTKAIAPEETTNAPAAPAATPLPGTMEEVQAQLKAMRELFSTQQAEVNRMREEARENNETIALLKAGQDAIASGKVKTLFRHCNCCGRRLREGEDFCPAHPDEHVNHVGLNPANGVMMLARQTKR